MEGTRGSFLSLTPFPPARDPAEICQVFYAAVLHGSQAAVFLTGFLIAHVTLSLREASR